jgi:hypothetical protein
MDGVHPTHAVRFTRGWIKKGVRREIPTNGSRKRLNIVGGEPNNVSSVLGD